MYLLEFAIEDGRSFIIQVTCNEAKEKVKLFARSKAQKENQKIKKEFEMPLTKIQLDLGGAIRMGEPEVEFEVDNIKFVALARHLPALARVFSTRQEELEPLSGYISIRGLHDVYTLISVETREKIISVLQELIAQYAPQIHEEEMAIEKVFTEAEQKIGVLVRRVPCIFCGSDKKYGDCCGTANRTN